MAEEIESDGIKFEDDVENNFIGGFGSNKASYDKPALAFSAMSKCLEAGDVEMRSGYENKKIDKFGNVTIIPVDDSRKKYISCVRTAAQIISPDFDNEAENNILNLLDSIQEKKKEFVYNESNIWKTIPEEARKGLAIKGIFPMPGEITMPLNIEFMIEYQLEVYRNIFTELNHLLSRIKHYTKKVKFG